MSTDGADSALGGEGDEVQVPAAARDRGRGVALLLCAVGTAAMAATVPVRDRLDAAMGSVGADLVVDFALYNLVYVAAAVCVGLAGAGGSRRERLAWWALSAGILSSALGNAWYTLVLVRLPEIPYPSLADLLWLVWYPLGYLGIVLLLTSRVGRFPLSVWLDGLVAGAGAAALAAALWFEPLTATRPGTPLPTLIVSMAYPVFDLLLICLLAGVAYMVRLSASWWLSLLAIGYLATGVADVVSAVQVVGGSYVEGGWVDPLWLLGVLAIAGASFPARRTAHVDALSLVTRHSGGSLRVLAVPLAAAAGSLVLLQLGQGDRFPPVAGLFAGVCITAAGLRAALTFRDLARLADVHREARTDDLTRLANRRALYESTERALGAAVRAGRTTSLLLIDLDDFKEVNDSLGHAVGDELLVAFARRMEAVLRPGDLLARLGGDEFAVLCASTGSEEAVRLAWRLVAAARDAHEVSGVRMFIGVSVGVASLSPGTGSRGDLLRQADVAMYQAKGSPQRVSTFDAAGGSDEDSAGERLALLTRLREGLTPRVSPSAHRGHVELHLQTQVDLTSGQLRGVEALARWRDADGTLLQPDEFLPLVQRGGLLPALATQVLAQAVAVSGRLRAAGIDVPVAVNLSAVDIHDTGLPGRVAALLDREGLPSSALIVELTEDSLVADPDAAARVLTALRDLGVRVSLDDFGTGFSSLAYLRRLPVDEVKLDRSFTIGVGADAAADAVVAHTVGLVHALGLHLVAEGVEDLNTALRLRELGCDSGQGFLWSTPMPLEEFLADPTVAAHPHGPAVGVVG